MARNTPGTPDEGAQKKKRGASKAALRLAKYVGIRGFALVVTILIGVYLTVLIANMGGYVDEIRKSDIRFRVNTALNLSEEFRHLPPDMKASIRDDEIAREFDRLGFNRPFIARSFEFLWDGLSLNLGRAQFMTSDAGSSQVKNIILERLPITVVLFVTANLLVFFSGLLIALALARRYGSFFDRVVIALAPLSAAPAWFYGIFLILIFASIFQILPYGGMIDAPPPQTQLGYILSVLKHMILPILAWFLAYLAIGTYGWRTFFLIHSSEDYVELAKAKGLTDKAIERRYILRPTLPTVITNFALTLIFAWQGAIITETVFAWPGLGALYAQAIGNYETGIIIGLTVMFSYLLAITVFTLDIAYALIDPRVKLGASGRS